MKKIKEIIWRLSRIGKPKSYYCDLFDGIGRLNFVTRRFCYETVKFAEIFLSLEKLEIGNQ